MTRSKMTKAEEVLSELSKMLYSKAQYNSELKIIAYKHEDSGENFAPKRMFDYLRKEAGEDNGLLRKMSGEIKYIFYFPNIQGFFMEKFGGYKRI